LVGGALAGTGGGKQLRIGLVLDYTSVNDPYQRGAVLGLQRAVNELGVAGKVVTPRAFPSFLPSFSYLARKHYDLIIAVGFFEVRDLDTAARTFPKRKFAIVDSSINDLAHHPRNVGGTEFRSEQAGFLAGYLAALLEKRRPGPDVIGSVGGVRLPTVDDYIAGYQAGAKRADPGIKLLNAYSNDFLNQAKCRSIALQQIAAGAGAVFQVAGSCGLGALAAAKAMHVRGIGVDVDQSFLGPQILTSAVKRLDVAVFDTIESFKRGRFRPGVDAVFDLRNNGVGLGKISPKVPRSLLGKLDGIRAAIVDGKIKVPAVLR
jgi:basic membrane protein A